MAEHPDGYRDILPDDQAKARKFFERGKTVADTGNYDYAISMYFEGLAIDPDAVEAHQTLREISMMRKASGGKDLGMMEKMKLKRPTKNDRQNMLNAERMLAYDPGNMDPMVAMMQNAHRAGFYDTVLWIGNLLLRANLDSKNPEFHKFLTLKDIYQDLKKWKLAIECCQQALRLRPDDMDLPTELKNLGAFETMDIGGYQTSTNFQESIRDKEKQQELVNRDKDVVSEDVIAKRLREAEAHWRADPGEYGKLMKYVECLENTEDAESENRAIELLEDVYAKSRQFRFRQRVGKIKMAQMARMERSLRAAVKAEPNAEALKKDYAQFRREQVEFELAEYTLATENYPTDLSSRYQTALRLAELDRYDEAIPLLQQSRSDPKLRNRAGLDLGKAFLKAGFVDEAVDTLQELIEGYELKGDDLSKEMYYWSGRALEEKGQIEPASKRYSQVFMWEASYRDVQTRIKAIRAKRQGP